jgi:hypothetical protein
MPSDAERIRTIVNAGRPTARGGGWRVPFEVAMYRKDRHFALGPSARTPEPSDLNASTKRAMVKSFEALLDEISARV